MKKENIKKYVFTNIAIGMALATLAIASPALADNSVNTPNQTPGAFGGRMGEGMGRRGPDMMRPAVVGTVSAISGNTITISGDQGFVINTTATTFIVDATNAKIMKDNTTGTISSIVVGDTVVVQGTVNGTNVVATMIRDGKMPPRGGKMMGRGEQGQESQGKDLQDSNEQGMMPTFTGNGQPVVAGKVSAINGNTISITNKSNVSYTVDATSAKITQGPNTITVAGITVGDMVVVQGTVNGNSIIAANVMDQAKIANTTNTNGSSNGEQNNPPHKGFFGRVGSFFSGIFGF